MAEKLAIDLIELAFNHLRNELENQQRKYPPCNSPHELYGVLMEEVCEYFDSIRANRPDPEELLQIAALTLRGYIQALTRKFPELDVK